MSVTATATADSTVAAESHAYAVTLEYDGTDFDGWQRQPGRRTVEAALVDAVAAVTGETVRPTAAGRTDAGAHAHGQVAGIVLRRAWEPERLRAAIDSHLPRDVAAVAVARARPGFHARFDAQTRTYRYAVAPRPERHAVARQYAWTVRGPLDLEAMRRTAALLVGRHDLHGFGRSPRPGGSTVRTVHEVRVTEAAPPRAPGSAAPPDRTVVLIDVVADAFLQGMMRSIAGALVAVGTGRITVDGVAALLRDPAPRHRPTVAPAHGLHQWAVTYPAGTMPDRPNLDRESR